MSAPNKLKARAIERIKQAWAAGASLSNLAAAYDVTEAAIVYHVKGLSRHTTPPMGRPRTFSHERALKLWQEGFTLEEVAARFGVSKARISQIARAHSRHNERKAAA